MSEFAQLLPLTHSLLWLYFAVFIRVGAIMAVMPAFGDQAVPARVRLALAIMFTFIVTPALTSGVPPVPTSMLAKLAPLGSEVIVGLFFGLVLRFFILTLQIAGTIAAQSTSLAQIFGGTAGVDPQPAIGHTLVVAGTALAALTGLHVQAAAYMIHSYDLVPFGIVLRGEILSHAGTGEVSRAFSLGFRLAAPFLIASLIYNVTLGIINRAMPQLMVSFVGAPAITAGGLLLFLISAPIMLSIWIVAFSSFMASPFGNWP